MTRRTRRNHSPACKAKCIDGLDASAVGERVEDLAVEQFVAEPGVEALDEAVSLGDPSVM